MTEIKKETTIYLPTEIRDKLRELSEKSGFSMTEIISMVVNDAYEMAKDAERISLIVVPWKSKSIVCVGVGKLVFGTFESNASDKEVDAEVKRRTLKEFEEDGKQ